MKARAKFDQRGDTTLDLHETDRGLGNPSDQFQCGAFAGSIAPDNTVGAALRHAERHVLERLKRLFRSKLPDEVSRKQRTLQRGELTAAIPAVGL